MYLNLPKKADCINAVLRSL